MALAAKGVQPQRMAREVEIIASEWRRTLETDAAEVMVWLDELFGQLVAAAEDAEEWLADVDRSEPAAVKQAKATLEALVATREATARERAALCV
jgi:translation initiation factor 2 alpha subunit (eIF-2alpha)